MRPKWFPPRLKGLQQAIEKEPVCMSSSSVYDVAGLTPKECTALDIYRERKKKVSDCRGK